MSSFPSQLALLGLGPTELLVILVILAILIGSIVLVVWLVVRRSGSNSQAPGGAAIGPVKKCPDCAEVIQAEARVCKHCSFRFDAHSQKA